MTNFEDVPVAIARTNLNVGTMLACWHTKD